MTANFRSNYNYKVGISGIEEKKSLEILFHDNPLNKEKLSVFCLRCTVPGTHRNLVWKVLLGVTPKYSNNIEFVADQRKQVFEQLYRGLQVMRIVNDDTTKPQLYLLMWLLECGQLKYNLSMQLDDPMFRGFLALSDTLSNSCIFSDDVDIYWVSKGFYNHVQNFTEHILKLVEATWNLLEKEDKTIHNRLISIKAFDVIFVDRWFWSLFAGLLHENALVKIWDKVLGGSYKILIFVAVVIFTTLKRNILNMDSSEALLAELKCISEQTSEVIVNKAIELWQKYNSPLVIGDARKDKSDPL